MTNYGVTADGFSRKPYTVIKAELESGFRSAFGDSINLAADSVFGKIVAITAANTSQIWELDEAVFNSQYPDTAEGVPLHLACGITGIDQLAATKMQAVLLCTGAQGTVLPTGREVSHEVTGERVVTTAALTIDAAACFAILLNVAGDPALGMYSVTVNGYTAQVNWLGGTALSLIVALRTAIGVHADLIPLVTTEGGPLVSQFYVVNIAEAQGLEYAPLTMSIAGPDMSVVSVISTVLAEADTAEYRVAPMYTLTVIETPVAGWNVVTNPLDSLAGADAESDTAMRTRRWRSLHISGSATVDAIRAKLLEVEGVSDVAVLENASDDTDSEGRPPHSVHCVVLGGDSTEIAETIWEHKPAGIETWCGATGVTLVVTDSQGEDHEINFDRPTTRHVWVRVTVVPYAEEVLSADPEALIKDAVVDYGDALPMGRDVLPSRMVGPIFTACNGLGSVTVEAGIGTSSMPPTTWSSDPVEIQAYETTAFSTAHVEVRGL